MIEIGGVKFYTTDEVAEMFGVTPVTIRRYIKAGQLKAKRLGKRFYIPEQSLIKALEGDLEDLRPLPGEFTEVIIDSGDNE